jgi:Glucosidase II beta subunit-like protein
VDESPGVCEDICDKVLQAEREARAKIRKDFDIGSNKRKHELFKFKQFRKEKLAEIEQLEKDREALDPQPPLQLAADMKVSYAEQRMKIAQSIVAESTLLAGISPSELRTIIVLACQVAGELVSQSTCESLRLAGLELGMMWDDDNYDDREQLKLKDNVSQKDWATIIFGNVAYDEKSWTVRKEGSQKHRRRLEEDGMYEEDGFHDYDEDHHDDDFMPDEHDEEYGRDGADRNRNKDNRSALETELIEGVRALPFSVKRRAFLTRSAELVGQIAAAVKPPPDGEEMTDPVDPAAFNVVKSSLRAKETAILNGFKSGASASLFLSANEELAEEQLRSLAMFTIYHGHLSTLQVWQIVLATVEGLEATEEENSEQTCASPWAGYCPPKTIDRDGVVIPSSLLAETGEKHCLDQSTLTVEACADVPLTNGIPTFIPDGYFGYVAPMAAGDDDPVTKLFDTLATFPIDKEAVEKLEEENERIEDEIKSLEGKIKSSWKEIGGKSGQKMGPNGELYPLANQCFSVESGKYTYEVCVFRDAKQKEGTDGGTQLGKFTRMEYTEETGERILYWENGQRCWNGPARSATVHLTCGAENKVLSADEPDTCRYVLQMESYIACDEDYKIRMGL